MIVKALIFIASSVVIYFGIALLLIGSQRPGPIVQGSGLEFGQLVANRFELPQDPAFQRATFATPDGQEHPLTVVHADGGDALPLVVMIHGSGWHGQQFDRLAWNLRDVAEVWAVTLRGHGENPARRGDIDHADQFEDDLAHLISGAGTRPVVLLGHSSGGGLVVRFAGGRHRDLIDGAILLAPFLKHDAPVTRPNSGGWAFPMTRRIVGLSMLNQAGIRALDHLTVIQFAMPRAVRDGPLGHTATTAYSWRLNKGFSPRADYLRDVAALPPFLLIAGTADAAFDAAGYAPLLSGVTDKGRYVTLDGVGHLDLVDTPKTEDLVREYLRAF